MSNATSRNLKILLEKNKISPSKLSIVSGIDKPIISRILSGKTTNPQVETLKPIAEYFGISIDQLIGTSPLPHENTHGVIIPIKRLMIPVIDWKNVPYWLEIKDRFIPYSTIDVRSTTSPDAFGLIIANHSFEPRISMGTTIIVDPTSKPTNRDYIITVSTDSGKNDTYSGLTIKQYIAEKNKKFLKNVGPHFEMTSIKNNLKCFGIILEAFINLQHTSRDNDK